MREFIARENISRFQMLIAAEPAGPNRDLLERMLAEEQAKLRTYESQPGSTRSLDRAAGESDLRR